MHPKEGMSIRLRKGETTIRMSNERPQLDVYKSVKFQLT